MTASNSNGAGACKDLLPTFAHWRERLIAAEQGSGWLDECDDAGRFLAVSRELVDALARTLRRLAGEGPVLEVCAGSGMLVRALAAAGVQVHATDAKPPEGAEVLCLSAEAALRRFEPAVVLGVFVPFDAGVDEAVLACPSVRHYVVVNARLAGALGSPSLWRTPGWECEPLDELRRWLLTRHDVWLGPVGPPPSGAVDDSRGRPGTPDATYRVWGPLSHRILQHGEAWHFARTAGTSLRAEDRMSLRVKRSNLRVAGVPPARAEGLRSSIRRWDAFDTRGQDARDTEC